MTGNRGFQVSGGDLIYSDSSVYIVEKVLGGGAYGDVTECKKLATDETVAVKILKTQRSIEDGKEEEKILKMMKELNPDKYNIVRWNDSFTYKGRYCLEFEKLDVSLHEFLQDYCGEPLKLMEIRPILQQLATALNFLKSAGIVHADLKPENVMMVDNLQHPYKLKVIDFGLALNNPEKWMGATLQTLWYRSPEVLLGCSFNEAIDVWSVGCIGAEMLMGTPLFPARNEYDMMRHILHSIGKPPNHMLEAGLYTKQFFRKYSAGLQHPLWKFQSPLEKRNCPCNPCTVGSLSELNTASHSLTGDEARAEACDRASFHDLLARMLELDPHERITPSQILQHPFITMSHIAGEFDGTFYVKVSRELMNLIKDKEEDHHAGPSSREQPLLRSSVVSSETPPTKKRQRDGGSRSPDTTPAKKKRKACQDAAPAEKGGQLRPQPSRLHKRKRDDAESRTSSDGGSLEKTRRSASLNKERLRDSETWSRSTPDEHLKKRKRTAEEACCSKQATTIPVKTKRRKRRSRKKRRHLRQC